ncbi:glycosyltransferase family 2 protein [Erythrobacter sp. R86502]|uniref:glycosyltransferase family 2 protein n=1 Tax=Erythrobacter sp. R86502 TaxID=3093846 RepID=UPI0036D3AD7A
MTSPKHDVEPARSIRHAIVAARLGMEESVFAEWLSQRLGDRSPEGALPAPNVAPWENTVDANFSTYQKSAKYSRLHYSAEAAVLNRYRLLRKRTDGRIAFISAISGGYDSPKWHEHLVPTADYLLFSDTLRTHPLYEVRPFCYFNADPVRTARFVKTHPHIFASDYEVAVWVDGNIIIRGDLTEEIDEFIRSGLPIGVIRHPFRASIYGESVVCIARAKDGEAVIDRQLARYRAENVAPDFLIETNLMMFRVNHPDLPMLMNRWWGEIENGSRRDQISLPYAIQTSKVECHWITSPSVSTRNHRKLVLVDHERHCDTLSIGQLNTEISAPPFREIREARIAAQAGRRMDVIVCVHNALECVQRCLASVAANRDPSCHRIIIVNDGSTLDTGDWLREFVKQNENCHLIEHDVAQGYTRAANAGMALSAGEALVLLNSDTEVPPCWIEKLFDTFDTFPDIGIVGPLSNAASHQSLPDHRSSAENTAINELPNGFKVADMDRWCEQQADNNASALVPLVHGFCFAIRRELRDAIGGFDELAFPHGYGEESDYCMRAANAGFLLAIALHTFVFHEKSKSYETEKRQALMKNGSEKLREVHGQDRVANAVKSMQENPAFARLRHLSSFLPYKIEELGTR